jgi:hypothetical protein
MEGGDINLTEVFYWHLYGRTAVNHEVPQPDLYSLLTEVLKDVHNCSVYH